MDGCVYDIEHFTVDFKKNLEWKKIEWENTSGIKATEKVGGHCWALFRQVPPLT